jgi:hypothetical protein
MFGRNAASQVAAASISVILAAFAFHVIRWYEVSRHDTGIKSQVNQFARVTKLYFK